MKFTYFGTAAAEGIPGLFCQCEVCARAQRAGGRNIRARSCAMVEDRVLLDFAPDMFTFKVRHGLDLAEVDGIFFTHSHIDHLAATELCYYHAMYANRRDPGRKLRLYGNDKVLEVIRAAFVFDMEEVPDCIALHRVAAFEPVTIAGLTLTPLPVLHDPREQCMVYLLERDGLRMLYGNDTAMLPREVFDFLQDKYLHVASLDCTAGRFSLGGSHMGFPDNLVVRDRLMAQGSADERTLFISHHFSHNGQVNYDDFAAMAQGTGFLSSYDGMELRITETGVVYES